MNLLALAVDQLDRLSAAHKIHVGPSTEGEFAVFRDRNIGDLIVRADTVAYAADEYRGVMFA